MQISSDRQNVWHLPGERWPVAAIYEARRLASLVADRRITQVVNEQKGV
jgi:hypothetical protein